MSPRRWFYDASGALAWPWRIVLFLAAVVICGIVAQFTVVPVVNVVLSLAGIRVATESWLWLAAFLGAHLVMLKVVERRPWSHVWLGSDAARPGVVTRGFLIGGLAIALPVLLLLGIGWIVRLDAPSGSWFASAVRVSLVLLPAAFTEELATRGYVFATICERWGWSTAIAVTSVAFGLLHLNNVGANVQSVSLVVLAGVFLAAVLWATRSLYAVWMAHFAWNWVLAAVFHTAVSGIPMEAPDYRLVDGGPDWATGGEWGPEGGAAGGVGMLGALAYFYARRTKRRREDS